jgi:hypothetical protein
MGDIDCFEAYMSMTGKTQNLQLHRPSRARGGKNENALL